MKTRDEWITEISAYIERLMTRNKNICYYFSVDMTFEIAGQVEKYFKEMGYITNFRKCNQCVNKFDIIIEWING